MFTMNSYRRWVKRVSKVKIGDPFDPSTNQGPQVSDEQFNRVMSYIESGKQGVRKDADRGRPPRRSRLFHPADRLHRRKG